MSDPEVPAGPDADIREALCDDTKPMDQVAARRRLAEICAEISFPMPPELNQSDVAPEIIKAAIAEQVECVEARVPKMRRKTLIKIKNREKMIMPLFFHTPLGKEWVRVLTFSGRFGQEEMAMILGVRLGQLNDYIRGQGWDAQMVAVKREKQKAEWQGLVKDLLYEGKFEVMKAAVKATKHVSSQRAEEILRNIPQLRQLHEIMTAVEPTEKGEAVDYANLPAVNIGTVILSHQTKAFDPAAAAKQAKAAEVHQPALEEE